MNTLLIEFLKIGKKKRLFCLLLEDGGLIQTNKCICKRVWGGLFDLSNPLWFKLTKEALGTVL